MGKKSDIVEGEGASLLRRICPGRDFTPGEIEAVNIALASLSASESKSRIPRRFVALGDFYVKDGIVYECVMRPDVEKPSEACRGCAFCRTSSSDRWCLGLQCSKWDRADGINVWFVTDDEEGADDE